MVGLGWVASPRSSEVAARSVLAGEKSAAKLAQMAAKFVLIPATNRENQTQKKKKTRITTIKPDTQKC